MPKHLFLCSVCTPRVFLFMFTSFVLTKRTLVFIVMKKSFLVSPGLTNNDTGHYWKTSWKKGDALSDLSHVCKGRGLGPLWRHKELSDLWDLAPAAAEAERLAGFLHRQDWHGIVLRFYFLCIVTTGGGHDVLVPWLPLCVRGNLHHCLPSLKTKEHITRSHRSTLCAELARCSIFTM